MSLSNKINFILISTLVIVLTVVFWIITDIESKNLKQQIKDEAEIVTFMMRGDIEKMFIQIGKEQKSLQSVVDEFGSVSGIEYIKVFDPYGYYVAATQHNLIGERAEKDDMDILEGVIQSQQYVENRKEEKDFFYFEQFIPIKSDIDDKNSRVINVIEVEIRTKSKKPEDVRDAGRLSQMISIAVEQSARLVISTGEFNLQSLQAITDNMMRFGFFHDTFIFNYNLDVIAATAGDREEPNKDSEQYKQIRNDIISGKSASASYNRIHEGQEVEVNVMPIYLNPQNRSEIVGLVEVHNIVNAFQDRINDLRFRMALATIILIIVLAVVLVLFLRREIIVPIKEYSAVAQKVASGDLNQRIEKTSKDEIGRFGDVFNLMVSNLRELDKLKSEFISVAAHQLRTPLSAVKWAVKMVIDGDVGPVNEEQKNILDQGYKSNERMIALINDLLDVSRIEAGRFEYEFLESSLEDLIETSIQEFQQIVKHKSISLKYHKPEKPLPKVKMDSLKLKMVIENLVDNAVKYTAPGGQVEVLFKYYRSIIEVIVSDSGVGIPKDQLPQLFSKFFRAKNVIRMQTDGTGLGLFIAKKIVEEHGGIIWVESEEGRGTKMHFTLPIA
ncbi:MAG: Two-component sensor kinase [Parcubacteria group bacterium GW2011_GWD2_38_12]|uniref:histidine kinase n=1 Tax=Candidatus Azambacteria bacterium RIFCSPLOWO2_01_FULL_37_9 TaxID=1797297 RepID=A0A1F5C6R9_9BACT|nr:MAG: Two-component sensor kinase [Parcubacteria group bacterium GW2011_GWC2_36_17]KKQ52650.1 MAG: Two-component sensor kinase [Parcubacteria group bacterium GW2011_GWD2_38_12]KKQ58832.1 MAG: Two-component sensor kinase [Parcubacteria group bacterium GW2011_GWC1_38_17]KKQ59603.1 MAG: Two-component sensor kinase [Parcubacteria group bacterium GW2011_GWD1_38_16]OGD38559.1 MAG: hypothetical protein A2907_00785 [Candidatus Azambacteria bacterium RIFCSPLOWO2_01_FULL_37_9]